ncbi:MAG: hypothetical protein ACTHQ3_21510 [Motilibacteraceae bacterium]
MPVDVRKHRTLDPALAGRAHDLYELAFAHLRAAALQRHLMTRAELAEVLADDRVTKYVGIDQRDGTMCALATFTDDLSTMPLVSPEFFAARWPEHYAAGRCFYIGFVAVHPDYHGTGVFASVVSDMAETVGELGGVAVLDVCSRNSEVYRLPQAILKIAQTAVPGVTGTPVDTQTYWSYEAPVPAAPRSGGSLPWARTAPAGSAVVDLDAARLRA